MQNVTAWLARTLNFGIQWSELLLRKKVQADVFSQHKSRVFKAVAYGNAKNKRTVCTYELWCLTHLGFSNNVNNRKIVQNIGYYIGNIGLVSNKCAIDCSERTEGLLDVW